MQQSFGPDFSKWSPLRRGAYTRGRTYVAAPPPPPAAAVPRHFTQREAPNLICPASENPRIDFIRSGLLFEVHSSKLFFFFFGSLSETVSFSLILISFDNSNSFNNISKFSNSFNNIIVIVIDNSNSFNNRGGDVLIGLKVEVCMDIGFFFLLFV